MKWLVILVLLLVLLAIVAVRYRRQIQTAMYVYKMFRKMRQVSKKADDRQIETNVSAQTNAPLVRCLGCGGWVAENAALKIGSKSFYCSSNCLEKAVKVG